MKAVIQVVKEASVRVEGKIIGSIHRGLLILLGVVPEDSEQIADKLWNKIVKLRIFADESGKTNLSLADIQGSLLLVSQFTLLANCRAGNRPSFTGAAKPDHANTLYEYMIRRAKQDVAHVETGQFGAHMEVSLVNDGPFTIVLDTDELSQPKKQSSII